MWLPAAITSFSYSFSLSLMFSRTLSRSLTQAHTHMRALSHTHTRPLYRVSFSFYSLILYVLSVCLSSQSPLKRKHPPCNKTTSLHALVSPPCHDLNTAWHCYSCWCSPPKKQKNTTLPTHVSPLPPNPTSFANPLHARYASPSPHIPHPAPPLPPRRVHVGTCVILCLCLCLYLCLHLRLCLCLCLHLCCRLRV